MEIKREEDGWTTIKLSNLENQFLLMDLEETTSGTLVLSTLNSIIQHLMDEESVEDGITEADCPASMMKSIAEEWNEKYPNTYTEHYLNTLR